MELPNQSVLILGAHSDIAGPLARLYAQDRCRVLLAARDSRRLQGLATDLRIRYKTETDLCEFDALKTESHQAFVDNLPVLPDTVITLVGLMLPDKAGQSNFEATELVIRSNYVGLVSVVEQLACRMEQRGSGTLIGVSSVAGDRGRASNYIYGSAKAAYSAFLSGLRNRLLRKGVLVITIKPGFVRTRMTEGLHLPARLTAEPEQLARAIHRAHKRKQLVVYYRPVWRLIMFVIRLLPEQVFARTKM